MNRLYTILMLSLTFWVSAFSQVEDQFLPSDQKQATKVTEPATLRKGFVRVGIEYFYGSVKEIFNNEAEKELLSGAAAATASKVGLWVYYGITDRIEVNIHFPYMLNRIDDMLIIEDPLSSQTLLLGRVNGYGVGDIALGIRSQAIRENDRMPSVTLAAYLEIPTGRKNPSNITGVHEFDEATGAGEFALDFNAQMRKIVYPYSFVLYSGYEYKFGGSKIHFPGEEEVSFKSGNHFYTIAGFNFHLNDWICVTNDLKFNHHGNYIKDHVAMGTMGWEFSWIPNIHFQIRRLRLIQGINVPILGRNTSADPSYILFVQYIF